MMNRVNIPKIFAFERLTKQLIQLLADLTLISGCFFLALWVQDGIESGSKLTTYLVLLILLLTTLILFEVTGVNKNLIRFISLSAWRPLFISSILSAFILLGASKLVSDFIIVESVFIYFSSLFFTTMGVRFTLHGIFISYNQHGKKSIAVYGAGAAGRELVNFLQGGSDYKPIIFIDDNDSLNGYKISGLKVLNYNNAINYCLKSNIDTVLLAIPSLSHNAKSKILRRLQNSSIKVKSIPSLNDIIEGNAKIYDLKNLAVEDLLGRDPVPPKRNLMSKNIKGKTVLVTGAGGSIGSELCRQIIQESPRHLILFETSEFNLYKTKEIIADDVNQVTKKVRVTPILGSVQDKNVIRAAIKKYCVQTIYHAAAFKHVSIVESNVIESIKNNIFGTFTCAEVAFSHNVESFILISTDKAVRPTSIMGATKRIAELVCQSYSTQPGRTCFSIVRFGNVLGSSGSVIPKFEKQIENGGPVTVTDKDVTRYFMTVAEASQLVIQAGSMATGGEVFILDMGKPIKIIDLAKNMIRLSGKEPSLKKTVPKRNSIIEIEICGLQDGEKKYEELLIGFESTATQHTRIFSANEFRLSKTKVMKIIRDLRSAIQKNDIDRIHLLLKQAPIDYVSKRNNEPCVKDQQPEYNVKKQLP